jgi:hypothetical protein
LQKRSSLSKYRGATFNLISPPSSMNSGGFGTRCSKAQSLDETKLIRPDGVFSRAACRTFFPQKGLVEGRRHGEGGWATNLWPQYMHNWCEANHTDYWRRNCLSDSHVGKTRFHLTSQPSLHSASKRTKYLCGENPAVKSRYAGFEG